MILSNIMQIFLGICFVLFLLFLAYMIYNYESIVNFTNTMSSRKAITVFDGIMNFEESEYTFDTFNKNKSSYRDLTPSVNQNGGAEYSYNFWIYMDKNKLNSLSSNEDIILLLRGNKTKVPYINNTNCELVNNGSYILVKNPLIRMKSDGSAIIIEYNTLSHPDAYRNHGKSMINCVGGTWNERNKGLLGIYNMENYTYDKKWFMVSIVLKEINPENDILYKNKTSCNIYINGINALDRIVESSYAPNTSGFGSSAMRHNRAPLYVNPKGSKTIEGLQMANLSYFNYALETDEILSLFNKKFSKSPAQVSTPENIPDDKYTIAMVSEKANNVPIGF